MPVQSSRHTAAKRHLRQSLTSAVIATFLASVPSAAPGSAAKAKLDGAVWTTPSCVKPPSGQPTATVALPLALLGLLLPKLAESGLTYVGNAIAKAGAPVERHASASVSTSMYSLLGPAQPVAVPHHPDALEYDENPSLQLRNRCITAVFGLARPDATPRDIGVAAPTPLQPDGKALDAYLIQEINQQFDPQRIAVIVAELKVSPDLTAFQFVPQYIEFAGALMDKKLDEERSAVFTISILPPGGTTEGAATAVRTFSFPDLSSPKTVLGKQAEALQSSWIPLPAAPDPVKARITATSSRRSDYNALADVLTSNAKPDEQDKARLKQARLKGFIDKDNDYLTAVAPVTFRVDLVETRPGSKFLVALGQALAANAKDLSTPISDALNPEKRATAAATEADNQDTLRIAAINAATDLQKAKDAKDPNGLRIAQIKAAAACRKLEAAGYADPACVVAP